MFASIVGARQIRQFNKPEAYKNKKRTVSNLSSATLTTLANDLALSLRHNTNGEERNQLKRYVDKLTSALKGYIDLLEEKNNMRVHAIDGECTTFALPRNILGGNPRFHQLQDALATKDLYEFIDVSDFSPANNYDRHIYMKSLKENRLKPQV